MNDDPARLAAAAHAEAERRADVAAQLAQRDIPADRVRAGEQCATDWRRLARQLDGSCERTTNRDERRDFALLAIRSFAWAMKKATDERDDRDVQDRAFWLWRLAAVLRTPMPQPEVDAAYKAAGDSILRHMRKLEADRAIPDRRAA